MEFARAFNFCKKVLKFFKILSNMVCLYSMCLQFFQICKKASTFFEVRFTNVWSVSVLSVYFYMKKGFCLSVLVLMSVSCVSALLSASQLYEDVFWHFFML